MAASKEAVETLKKAQAAAKKARTLAKDNATSAAASAGEKECEFLSIDWESNRQQLQKLFSYKADPTIQNHLIGIMTRLFFFLNREKRYLIEMRELHVDQYVKAEAKHRVAQGFSRNPQTTASWAFKNAQEKKLADEIRLTVKEEDAREVRDINIKLAKLDQIEQSLKNIQNENGLNNSDANHLYDPYLVELEIKLILAQHFMKLKDLNAVEGVLEDFSRLATSLREKYKREKASKSSQIKHLNQIILACQLMESNAVQERDCILYRQELQWCELILSRLKQIIKGYLPLRDQYLTAKKAHVEANSTATSHASASASSSSNTAAHSSPALVMILSNGPQGLGKTTGATLQSSTTASAATAAMTVEPDTAKPSTSVSQNK